MESHNHHQRGHGAWRTMAQMMLGCCLAFFLLIVVAPFVGAWGVVFVLMGLLGCALMAAFHHWRSGQALRWLPGRTDVDSP